MKPTILIGREFSATIYGGFQISEYFGRVRIETPQSIFVLADQIIDVETPEAK